MGERDVEPRLAAAVRSRENAEVVEGDLEAERDLHQFRVADHVVLVEVECLEPARETDGELAIVPRQSRPHRGTVPLTRQRASDEIDRLRDGQGGPVEPRTVERVDESGRVADRGPTVVGDL